MLGSRVWKSWIAVHGWNRHPVGGRGFNVVQKLLTKPPETRHAGNQGQNHGALVNTDP
jgi:hypothetical protein